MSKQYRMTDEEHSRLLEASKPTRYMVFGGQPPRSPTDKALDVWRSIAERVGCRFGSIGPGSTGDDKDFEGEPL